jgi:hypothetical protein
MSTQSIFITFLIVVFTMGLYMTGPVLITYSSTTKCNERDQTCEKLKTDTLTAGIVVTITIFIIGFFLKLLNVL